MTQQKELGRLAWADACRLIAMLGVIIIHVSAPIFYSAKSISLGSFLTATALDSVARVAVPLFAMLSGALLLGREGSGALTGVMSRLLKVAIPLAFWSVIYVFWVNYWEGRPLSITGALLQSLKGPVMYHLWFVYMIMGVYVVLPILQPLSVALLASKRFAVYFFGIWFLANAIKVYDHEPILNHLVLTDFLHWPGYFLLGFYLSKSNVFKALPSWFSLIVLGLASATTFLLSWYLNSDAPAPVETAMEYFSPNVMLASVAAFLLIGKIELSPRLIRPVAFFSGLVFPVYFMHLLVIELIKSGMLGFTLGLASMSSFSAILSLSLATFFVSLGIAAVTRAIPYSSRLVG
ncbi:acyltransferase [Pseudomonas costantinii]|uniref:Surface polysaccharide O-acyltransferase, integral membrane enzyme n=1 Tax=Pseudomonas costantinii TaxID=168469 RepID=A0A1S2V863_9PSED|nr:acyltransferase family protein [Pseudomonas costantinii]OIN54158.1 hypothetical protein BFL40_05510 [Pseudomonas costantinii]SED61782.1 Surface polysaccharide O-acyltransferase, integral membrane enzyme [Pseudomonas costantinii]